MQLMKICAVPLHSGSRSLDITQKLENSKGKKGFQP